MRSATEVNANRLCICYDRPLEVILLSVWFAWIFLLGTEEEAAKWETSVKICDAEKKSSLEFTGPVFPIDMEGKEVMDKMTILAMSDKQIEMMKSDDGIKHEEQERGFNSKIVITYDVDLKG